MNHMPFEDWLLEPPDEGLDAQQTAALHSHLATCSECAGLAQAWPQMERRLRAADLVEPRPGFADRWQARWQADLRQRAYRRQAGLALGFSLGGAAALLALLTALAWPWLQAPELLVWAWGSQLLALYGLAGQVGLLAAQLARPAALPLALWAFLCLLLALLAVVWAASYRLLTYPRRITK